MDNKNDFKFNDDDFVIGKGFSLEESGNNEKAEKRKASKKRTKNAIKNIVWILCIIVVSVTFAIMLLRAGADYLGISTEKGKDVHVVIPKDASIEEISKELKDAGLIKMPWLFKTYSKIKGYDVRYQDGLHTISTESGYAQIADELVSQKGFEPKEVKVTIPEGTGINDYVHIVNGEEKTVKGLVTILDEEGVCEPEDFYAALDDVKLDTKLLKNCNVDKVYYALEGYLFPDTYKFYAYDSTNDSSECARMVIQKIIENTENKITDEMYEKAKKMGYSMNEILTMASIVQMEAGNSVKAMPDVAAVFYNRLDSKDFSTLGSSPTCYYGYSFGRRDDGRYDTYKINGLPPGPLCSPGLAAIKAALNPSKTSYYYFLTDSNGKFYFHKTYNQQLAKEAELRKSGMWIEETFRTGN